MREMTVTFGFTCSFPGSLGSSPFLVALLGRGAFSVAAKGIPRKGMKDSHENRAKALTLVSRTGFMNFTSSRPAGTQG